MKEFKLIIKNILFSLFSKEKGQYNTQAEVGGG